MMRKLLALAMIGGLVLLQPGCKAGRVHTLKQTVTDPTTGVVTEFEFESGITALNQKMAWEQATFEESLGLNGSIWKNSGEAGGVETSPETRVLQSLETFASISRGLQNSGAPPETEERLDRLERLIEERLLVLNGPVPSIPPDGSRASVLAANGETTIFNLTPEEAAQLKYLRSLRDAPNEASEDTTPPAD